MLPAVTSTTGLTARRTCRRTAPSTRRPARPAPTRARVARGTLLPRDTPPQLQVRTVQGSESHVPHGVLWCASFIIFFRGVSPNERCACFGVGRLRVSGSTRSESVCCARGPSRAGHVAGWAVDVVQHRHGLQRPSRDDQSRLRPARIPAVRRRRACAVRGRCLRYYPLCMSFRRDPSREVCCEKFVACGCGGVPGRVLRCALRCGFVCRRPMYSPDDVSSSDPSAGQFYVPR